VTGASARFCRLAHQGGHPAPYRSGVTRRQLGNPWCRSRLPQAEVAENEEHYHYDANNVENAVHVVFSFLSRDRITGAPDSKTLPRARLHERTGRAEAVRSCLRSPCWVLSINGTGNSVKR
jgi:hypothetical protein